MFIILIRADSNDLSWDDSTGDLFATSNSNLFDETTVSTSSNTLDDSTFLNAYSSTDGPLVTDPSLVDLNQDSNGDLFASNNLNSEEGSSISGLDLSLVAANCGDSSIQSDYFLLDDYSTNPSTDISASTVDFGDPSLTDDFVPLEDKQARIRKPFIYVPPPTYDLAPSTGPYTPLEEAVAEDGTPIRPKLCAIGKTRKCCLLTDPPFSRCWLWPRNREVCSYARNQFCCGEYKYGGGPASDCEEVKWIEDKARSGEKQGENTGDAKPSEESISNQLEELFPILQPLPDINPPPAYCKPGTRRRVRKKRGDPSAQNRKNQNFITLLV